MGNVSLTPVSGDGELLMFLLPLLIWWMFGIIASIVWLMRCKRDGKPLWWKQAMWNSLLGIINWSVL